MKTSIKMKTLVLSCLLGAIVGINGAAQAAAWMVSHGNVAQIQYPTNCSSYMYTGNGLDLQEKPGTYNWIHLTVPTQCGGTVGTRYFKLLFYTGSVDAGVTDIIVYNGRFIVKEYRLLSLSNGWKDLQFDLGSKMSFFRGMGISIRIGAGREPTASHQFIFSSAGAYSE
jgi:hypothetical protein